MDLNKDLKEFHLNITPSDFTIVYRRYKSFLIPVVIILVSVLIFFVIVMPQIRSVLDLNDQAQVESIKLEKLRNNYNLLTSMDQATLDSNLSTLTAALPSNKDFAGIITSLSSKSLQAGVAIGDFSFSVGELSDKNVVNTSFPYMLILISVSGDPKAVINFINLLYKSAPMVEVTAFNLGENSANITLQFFYKTYPQGTISDDTQVVPLTPKEISLITELSTWGNNVSDSFIPLDQSGGSVSSSSATLPSGSSSPF